MDGIVQVMYVSHATFRLTAVERGVEVKQHHLARFGIEAGEGDDADHHGQRQVVSQHPKEPERPDHTERNCEQHHGNPEPTTAAGVEQKHDQDEGDDTCGDEAGTGFFPVFKLAGEDEGVAGGKFDLLGHHPPCFGDVATEITAGDIDEHPRGALGVFGTDHRRAGADADALAIFVL